MVNVPGSHQSFINSGGDIFLWNKQIFVGINRRGCHGTDLGTINTDGSITSGPTFDLSGRSLGIDAVGLASLTVNNAVIPDYFLPGAPTEIFTAGYINEIENTNVGTVNRNGLVVTNITDYSTNDLSTTSKLIGYYTGQIADNLKIELTYSIEPTGNIIRVDVKMNNISPTEMIYDVRFARRIDPDNNQFITESLFSTVNTITVQNGKDASNNNSVLYSQIQIKEASGFSVPILTYSSVDPSSYVYLDSSASPYGNSYVTPSNNAGTSITGDRIIALFFKYGNISPLQSSTKTYYIGFGNTSDITNEIYQDINGGSGVGDPLIRPLFGYPYYLPNDESTYLLFDNNENLKIFTKTWLPMDLEKMSFMRYLIFMFNNEKFILDLDSMLFVNYNSSKYIDHNLSKLKDKINIEGLIIQDSQIFKNFISDYNGKKLKMTKQNKQMLFSFNCSKYIVNLVTISDLGYKDIRNNVDIQINGDISKDDIINFNGALISQNKLKIVNHEKIFIRKLIQNF